MLNRSKATWGDRELGNQIHLKCKCYLCVSLVILCYRGMPDHGSAGPTHLNRATGEGERVGRGAVTEQRLKERKKGFPPPQKVPPAFHFWR